MLLFRNAKSREIVVGAEDRVEQVHYAAVVTRSEEELDNELTGGWKVIDVRFFPISICMLYILMLIELILDGSSFITSLPLVTSSLRSCSTLDRTIQKYPIHITTVTIYTQLVLSIILLHCALPFLRSPLHYLTHIHILLRRTQVQLPPLYHLTITLHESHSPFGRSFIGRNAISLYLVDSILVMTLDWATEKGLVFPW